MPQPPASLTTTLYRELLRSCRRTRAVMRPTHVVLVGECVQRFAERSPALAIAVKQHGPLPLPALVRNSFRNVEPEHSNRAIDDAFGALRMMHSVEQWVTSSASPRQHTFFLSRILSSPPRALGQLFSTAQHHCSRCRRSACVDNALYDSLEGMSDREAPPSQSIDFVAQQLVAQHLPSSH